MFQLFGLSAISLKKKLMLLRKRRYLFLESVPTNSKETLSSFFSLTPVSRGIIIVTSYFLSQTFGLFEVNTRDVHMM